MAQDLDVYTKESRPSLANRWLLKCNAEKCDVLRFSKKSECVNVKQMVQ